MRVIDQICYSRPTGLHLNSMNKVDQLDLIKSTAIEPWQQIGKALTEQKAIEAADSPEAKACVKLAADILRLAGELGLNGKDLAKTRAVVTLSKTF